MKHIKLFEAFNSYSLPNFRVSLVKPGMTQGKYLFTCVEGNWDSYWGIFDLEGLKVLEDAMNTRFVIEELQDRIIYKKPAPSMERGIHWSWPSTSIVTNKVPNDTKFIALLNRDMDWKPMGGFISMTNKEPQSIVTPLGELGEENVVFGYTAHAVKGKEEVPEYKGLPEWEEEAIRVFPAVLNLLYKTDNHWSEVEEITKDYFEDEGEDDPISSPYHDPVSIEDIQPYMPSIIDAGAPKGFLRILKRMEK
jgi:hypothetical protein